MSLHKSEWQSCERVQSYLDSCLNDELLTETNHDVQKHLDGCQACAGEHAVRRRVKNALQQAVESEHVPVRLRAQIREQIRTSQPAHMFSLSWERLAIAAALLVVVCVGTQSARSVWNRQQPANLTLQADLNPLLSDTTRRILSVGLSNHLHCAVKNRVANRFFGRLQPEYASLLPLVREKIGNNYEVVAAHHCKDNGRKFVHLILKNKGKNKGKNEEATLSLAVTKKNDAAFPDRSHTPVLDASEASLYQGRLPGYQVAGFEAGSHFAFMVSDLSQDEHLRISSLIAPPVRDLLLPLQAVAQR